MKLFHVAIIMDGNSRWAQKNGLEQFHGYEKGANTALDIVNSAVEFNIKYLTLFVFSSENWRRKQDNIASLFNLFLHVFARSINHIHAMGAKVNFFGEIELLPKEIQDCIAEAHKITSENKKIFLNIAISYGGRQDILNAVKKVVASGIKADEINNAKFGDFLYTRGMPDPDLIIRTGAEKRVSNFLLWQMAYSELYFCDKLWPDFSREDLQNAIKDYSTRARRYGC